MVHFFVTTPGIGYHHKRHPRDPHTTPRHRDHQPHYHLTFLYPARASPVPAIYLLIVDIHWSANGNINDDYILNVNIGSLVFFSLILLSVFQTALARYRNNVSVRRPIVSRIHVIWLSAEIPGQLWRSKSLVQRSLDVFVLFTTREPRVFFRDIIVNTNEYVRIHTIIAGYIAAVISGFVIVV